MFVKPFRHMKSNHPLRPSLSLSSRKVPPPQLPQPRLHPVPLLLAHPFKRVPRQRLKGRGPRRGGQVIRRPPHRLPPRPRRSQPGDVVVRFPQRVEAGAVAVAHPVQEGDGGGGRGRIAWRL